MTTVPLAKAAAALILGASAAMGQVVPLPPVPAGIQVDPDRASLSPILDNLHSGNAQQALAQANELLSRYPDSIWLNCAAGEAAVEAKDRLSLHTTLERLRVLSPEASEPCVKKLDTQYKRETAAAEIRPQALELIRAGKLGEARQLVTRAHLDPYEELLIEHYLDRAQAHFANALIDLTKLKVAVPSASAEATSLGRDTLRQQKQFDELLQRERVYLFDPIATSSCVARTVRDVFEKRGLRLEEFLRTARDLVRDYPSYPDVQQFYFMELVLIGTDESVEQYGDSVLSRYGKLSIPFFSKDDLYLLVLDRRKRQITLRENPAHPKNLGITDGLRVGHAFHLPYSAVGKLQQVVSNDLNTYSLTEKSAAIDLGPQGLAPYYSLMPAIHCLYGEKFGRAATERLGKFVARELGLPTNRVTLVDPNGTTHDIVSEIMTGVTIASAAAGAVAIQRQQQVGGNDQSVQSTSIWQQYEADAIKEQAQSIMEQQQVIAGEGQGLSNGQQAETAGLEGSLAELGFDSAFSLDVPGYLEILADMLRIRN